MTEEVTWPPISPHAALLSSPSGRRKWETCRTDLGRQSPIKHSATTPSLLERIRAARADNDQEIINGHGEEENMGSEEDEETLQLQLAAIEARLKLKKLQQTKNKTASVISTPNRTVEKVSRVWNINGNNDNNDHAVNSIQLAPETAKVEVALSPVKRQQEHIGGRSPGRKLLGIDKGVTGADVSLRRAHTVTGSSLRRRARGDAYQVQNSSRSLFDATACSSPTVQISQNANIPSFSERMANARKQDQDNEQKRGEARRSRNKKFRLNTAELDEYKQLAVQDTERFGAQLSRRRPDDHTYNRDEIASANSQGRSIQKPPGQSSTTLTVNQISPKRRPRTDELSDANQPSSALLQLDGHLLEEFSRLYLSSRILPHSFLQRTLPSDQFTVYKIPELLRVVKSPAYELPDHVGDYVIFGIIASKSGALDHRSTRNEENLVSENDWKRRWDNGLQNEKKFMALTLTDLKWSIDLYLFGTALPRYHRLTPGTLVAILNPSIMPPKKGREDTGAFSLSLNDGDDTVLEIGKAAHLGYCNVTKKDGKECHQWIDSSKTEICEWHLNLELQKTRAKRMGVNTGTNGFGNNKETGQNHRRNVFDRRIGGDKNSETPRGLLPDKTGPQYDRNTGSQFYLAKSNVGKSTSVINEDLFIDQVHDVRDQEARLSKRLALQEREREVAKQLTTLNASGAGAEYLRHRANMKSQRDSEGKGLVSSSQRSAFANRANIMDVTGDINRNKKRNAESVRLSPVKKTRFVTEKGIREAGRESIGVRGEGRDEDDGLDIV